MIYPILFGTKINAELLDVGDEFSIYEIKKFNLISGKYEHYNDLIEFVINDKLVNIENGFAKIKNELIPEPVVEPTQLDRIENMISVTNEEIAKTAVDSYTLQLMGEGVL